MRAQARSQLRRELGFSRRFFLRFISSGVGLLLDRSLCSRLSRFFSFGGDRVEITVRVAGFESLCFLCCLLSARGGVLDHVFSPSAYFRAVARIATAGFLNLLLGCFAIHALFLDACD